MQKPIMFKICVFGNCGVGKTTLITKCFKEISYENIGINPKKTIGVCFYKDKFNVEGVDVILQIWEISGNERFSFLFKDYVRGAAGAIFVYDITDKSSLDNLDEWLTTFRKSKKNVNIPILMVGNKLDIKKQRKITIETASSVASSKNLIGAMELSALNREHVKQLFNSFIKLILRVDPKRHLIDVFKSDLDLRILILLNIYKELSLTELSFHLGKSKATISRRTRELVRLELLESYSKDNEIQAGNIKRKYYTLNPNFNLIMEKKQFNTKEIISNKNWDPLLENLTKYSYEYNKIKFISDYLNNIIEALENFLLTSVAMEELPVIETIEMLMHILDYNFINFHYLTMNQYGKILSLNKEFHLKLEDILKKGDNSEKPFLYVDMVLPILSISKLGVKSGSYILNLRQQAKDTQKVLEKIKFRKD